MEAKPVYNNYPLDEVAKEASRIHHELGADVYQKFTCAVCGSRQTMDEPNVFYASGKCEECKATTDLRVAGCNYMIVSTTARGA